MKKLTLILTAAVFCLTFLSGCKDEKTDVKKEKHESISSAEANDSKESKESTNAVKEEASDNEKKNNDTDNSVSAESESAENENESNDDDFVSGPSYSNESGDITEIAVSLHEQSCETQWKYLVDCPYELDYEDASGEAFCVKGVSSLSEITAEYCQVFAEIPAEFSEKYFEENGKVYCRDGGRGGNIYYKGTELIFVSSDKNSASFTAVSHYADPETNEPMDSRSYDFKMIKDKEVWKTSVFTLPY